MRHRGTILRGKRLGRVLLSAALTWALAFSLTACAGTPSATPVGTPAVTLELVARNSAFDRTQLEVVAGSPFAIHFTNQDTIPHNVSIRGGQTAMVGELFTGPAERTHVLAALPAGTFTFICDLHPEMKGQLISE